MKTIYTSIFFFIFINFTYADAILCPDPPANDDPCVESINPPQAMVVDSLYHGTTCCARGPEDFNPDNTPADFASVDCDEDSQRAAVWYIYEPSEEDDGFEISLMTSDTMGSAGALSIEVYSGTYDQGCNEGFAQTLASHCNVSDVTIRIGNCLDSSEYLFIKVSSDSDLSQCGTFGLSLGAESHCGHTADSCFDVDELTTLEAKIIHPFITEFVCVTGCLEFACPEDTAYGGCPEFTEMPTVWYKITTEEGAAQMFTTVDSEGDWMPVWSIFSGPDCSNLTLMDQGGVPSCSDGDATPEVHQTAILESDSVYWIMITVDPESIPPTGIGDGRFDLCVIATVNGLICLGDETTGSCTDESLVIEVTDREYDDLSLDGPFMPGEEVSVHVSFMYDANESGADWFMGFVPMFGEGWDMTDFDYDANAPFGNGNLGLWYEEGGECAPILQEDIPLLCTYTDEDGNLQLCNILCEGCFECEEPGMEAGDPLPSGYFWVTNGGNAGCENDCSPGEGWGIGNITATIEWDFTLRVKDFDNNDDCSEKNDLSIGFQTFSDGTAGCWEDPAGECLLDRSMHGPAWEVQCFPVSVTDENPPSEIAIYPNPSHDEFYVHYDFNGPVDYEVRAVNGQIVKKGTVANSSTSISMDAMSSGLYFVSFSRKGEAWTSIRKLSKL